MDLGIALYEIFAQLGVGAWIDLEKLEDRVRLKGVSCSRKDLFAILGGWILSGKITDNGRSFNEYSSFKNLNIKPVVRPSIIKLVDGDQAENLDFPSGRVSE